MITVSPRDEAFMNLFSLFPRESNNNAEIFGYLHTSSNLPNIDNRAIPGPHLHDEISEAVNFRFHLIQMKIAIIRSEVE